MCRESPKTWLQWPCLVMFRLLQSIRFLNRWLMLFRAWGDVPFPPMGSATCFQSGCTRTAFQLFLYNFRLHSSSALSSQQQSFSHSAAAICFRLLAWALLQNTYAKFILRKRHGSIFYGLPVFEGRGSCRPASSLFFTGSLGLAQ